MNNNQKQFDDLKKSTMFHMSLGSKELFHSNFLHWISIVNWDAFLNIMHGLAGVNKFWWEEENDNDNDNDNDGKPYHPHNKNIKVLREHKNFDLSIYILDSENMVDSNNYKDGDDDPTKEITHDNDGKEKVQKWTPVLVLENKMKSLPYEAQLKKYTQKAFEEWSSGKNTKMKLKAKEQQTLVVNPNEKFSITYILLTLKNDTIELKDEISHSKELKTSTLTLKSKWIGKTYENLLKLLEKVSFNKELDNEVIKDYRIFVKALCYLANVGWKVNKGDKYIEKICQGGAAERELRIHDIREKIHYEQLLKLLENKLSDERISFERFDTDELKPGSVFTKIDYSHGIGLFEVQYVVNEEWRLIIQVQGNRYCHMIVNDKGKSIVKKNGNVNEPICKNLLRNYGKFINDPTPNNPVWPNIVESPNKKYGRYGYSNIYQWSEILEMCTISQVIEAMCCDLKTIMKTWPKK